MSPVTVWEAHKSVIRGSLIGIATRKRKEATRNMTELYGIISRLELQHKRSQMVTIYRDRMEARRNLKALLTQRYLCSMQTSKSFFYTHANKGGTFLARLLRGEVARTQ
ncbi:Hypothetical predicted protein, partial [Pelobates cultripes]